jgi:tRNA-specific 2-thiouridylase
MLYTLKESMLSRISFPLGEYTKEEIRAMAEGLTLPNAKKKDSQDICFIENGRYAELIEEAFGKSPIGDYVDKEGKPLGKHRGLIHYTVGQHKKLGISFPTPMYVLSLLPEENQVMLGSDEDLYTTDVYVPSFSFISNEGAPAKVFRASAKIRYRQKEEPCTVSVDGEGVTIRFDRPQRAVTPGQSAVLYDGDTVLGGGIIQ